MPNDAADLPVSVPPQLFCLKTPMVSSGMVDNFVSETDTMKVSVKIYAEGGENFLHTHTLEDHFFLVLEGQASFKEPSGRVTTLGKHQGIMLPANSYYMFTASGATPLVLLRVAATKVQPWVKDSRKWWPGATDTRAPARNKENQIPGVFFAADSELPRA